MAQDTQAQISEIEMKNISNASSKYKVSSKRNKRRIIKNALVETDDVVIEAGDEYKNWIPIARDKIKVVLIYILIRKMVII